MFIIDVLLLIQLAFIILYPIKQYRKLTPDIFGIILCLGYLQFILIPILVTKYTENSFYPFYHPNNKDYIFFTNYLTILLFLFFVVWKLMIKGNRERQWIYFNSKLGVSYKKLISFLLFFFLIKKNLPSGFIFQALDYFLSGASAYIFLVLLLTKGRKLLKVVSLLLCLMYFWGSTVRFVWLIIAYFIYLYFLPPVKRPALWKLSLLILIVAITSLAFKVFLGHKEGIEMLLMRIKSFDLFNVETFSIAAHVESQKEMNYLIGRTFFTATIIPWLLEREKFVGMGKYYIKYVLHYDENPNWSIGYPYPYELLANFGALSAVLIFVISLVFIGLLIRIDTKGNFFINLWKKLFGLSFVFYLMRGDFVFAFVPTLFASLGGLFAIVVLFNKQYFVSIYSYPNCWRFYEFKSATCYNHN